MMRELPDCNQKVEILIEDNWVSATFVCADYYWMEDGDEVWWLHYYQLESGDTIPEDIQKDGPLPIWRPIKALLEKGGSRCECS